MSGTVAEAGSDGVTLSFDAGGLLVGQTYNTTLVINSNDPNEDPVEVSVELEVQDDLPDIEVTPLSFSLEANVDETFDKMLTIANVGGAALTWDLEDLSVGWLSATPMSGTVAATGSEEVTLSFDAGGLLVGQTYNTTLVINSNDPNEDPVEVPVELEVKDDLPDIEVTPLSFSLEASVGETFDKMLTIANVGGAALTWDLEDLSVGWLSATPMSGTVAATGSEEVTLSFDAGGLTVDETYSTVLVINSNDPNENPVEVPVELTVEMAKIFLPVVARNYAP
jgi:hypothetical protein